MRICLLTRYFTFRNAGIGRVSSEIANRLEARGHEVCRISTDTWSLYQYFKYTTFDLMTKIPKGYDIYHALTPLEATWIPKDRGVVTFYDFIPVLHPERAGTGLHSSWILKHGSKAYFNWACKMATRCKGLTAISQETKDELRTHFGVEKDITVVKLGIRPDLEPAEKPDSTFRIGYLGQLDRRKRVGLLVEAFYHSEIEGELVIAGTGPEEVRLKAIADGDDRIKFLGGIPDEDLPSFYNSLDMFVFPTFIEGYGLPCLPPDEKIITKDALKAISEVKIGDMVLTHTGSYHPVIDTFKRQVNEDIIEITPWAMNTPIKLTGNHPILAFKRPRPKFKVGRRWDEQVPTWIPAKDIEQGDCVVFPITRQIYSMKSKFDLLDFDSKILSDNTHVHYKMGFSPKTGQVVKIKRYINMDEKLSRLIGYYLAEGSVNSSNMSGVEFSLGMEPEIANEIKDTISEIFGTRCTITTMPTKIRVQVSSKIIGKFLSGLCGIGARNKSIPREFLYGDIANLKNLVECLYKCDGYQCGNEFSLSTSSEQMVSDATIALLRLGYKPRTKKAIRIRKEKTIECYNVEYSIANIVNYAHSNKSWVLNKSSIAFLVRKVNKIHFNGVVHNLEVAVDNSYTTKAFAVHNCVEAMACKKPVFVMSDSIIPEAVKSRCFEVSDLNLLFRSFRTGLPYWKIFSEAVIDSNYQFAKNHDWEKCVDTYEAMYRKILKGKK